MKVNLVFLEVEGARDAFGSLRFTFDMQGNTVGALIAELMQYYGSKGQRVFLKDGHYKGNTQIIVNWKKYVLPENMSEFALVEGDTIMFAPLVDGG